MSYEILTARAVVRPSIEDQDDVHLQEGVTVMYRRHAAVSLIGIYHANV